MEADIHRFICFLGVQINKTLVNLAANFPDFPCVTSENSNPTHVHHGNTEILKETRFSNGGSMTLNVSFCLAVIKKSCIGLEETPSLGHESEIGLVECLETPRIHLHKSLLIVGFAFQLQSCNVVGIQCGISVALPREVVKAVAEGRAVRRPNSVPALYKFMHNRRA